MSFTRWIPTFLAFPLGGLLAAQTVGSLHDPVSAAAGGLLAGGVIGAGQWLALRPRGIGARWVAFTAVAMAAGTALGAALTGAGTGLADLLVLGLAAGAAVGGAQGALLGRGRAAWAAWTAVTAGAWALGWAVSSAVVGANVDEGFFVFGSSGALLVTLLTGLALRRMLAAPPAPGGGVRPAVATSA